MQSSSTGVNLVLPDVVQRRLVSSPYSSSSSRSRNPQNQAPKQCSNCGTLTSSMWRRTANKQVACNACGLYYKLYGVNRPIEMRKDIVYPRNRYSKLNGGQPKGSPGAQGKQSVQQQQQSVIETVNGFNNIVRQQQQQQAVNNSKMIAAQRQFLNAGNMQRSQQMTSPTTSRSGNGGSSVSLLNGSGGAPASKYVLLTGQGNGNSNKSTAHINSNDSALDLGAKTNSSSSGGVIRENAKQTKMCGKFAVKDEEEDSVITEVKLEDSSDVELDSSLKNDTEPANLVTCQVKDESSEENSVSFLLPFLLDFFNF